MSNNSGESFGGALFGFLMILVVIGYVLDHFANFLIAALFAAVCFTAFIAYRAYRLWVAGFFDTQEVAARLNRKAREENPIIRDGVTGLPATAAQLQQDPFRLIYERVDPPPFGGDEIDHARFKDKAAMLETFRENAPQMVAVEERVKRELQAAYDAYAPPPSQAKGNIELIDVMNNIPQAIQDFIRPLYASDVGEFELFKDMRETLNENWARVADAHLPRRDRARGALLQPKDYDGTARELVDEYLQGTPFRDFFYQKVPFKIPPHLRFEGQWIVALPGRGKTTLLHSMFLDDVKTGACIILMDSKGDLINPIRKLKSIQDRLVILEPNAQFPLALNPLDLGASPTHTVALLEYLFGALLETKTTALQATLFRSVLMVMTAIPDATFSTFREFLKDGFKGNKRFEDAIRTLDMEDQDFFFKGEYDSKTYADTKSQLLWRIRDLTTRIPLLRDMFRAPKTKINMGELMDSGKIVIINNSKKLLDDDGAEFVGRFFIALVRAAANQRSNRMPDQKRPVYFYIDECQTVIRRDENIAGIIQECRSHKIAMILAHQATKQISSPITLSALTDCAIRMANPDEEAELLAPRFRATPKFLESLGRGEFATFVRDVTPTAVKLSVQLQNLDRLPQLMPGELRALETSMRDRYAMPLELIRQQAAPKEPRPLPQTHHTNQPAPLGDTGSRRAPPVQDDDDFPTNPSTKY